MAWAIISDIHGNLQALEAVLEAMGEVEGVLCLGDVVGYGAEPEECCQMIKKLGPLVLLKGNHEAGVLGELPLSWFSHRALLALIWTREVLSQEALDFVATFAAEQLVDASALLPLSSGASRDTPWATAQVLLVHGSPVGAYEYLDSIWGAEEAFRQTQVELCFFGHTHFAGWFELLQADVGAEPACGESAAADRTVSAPGERKKARRRRFGEITEVADEGDGPRWNACPRGGLIRLEKGKRYLINCGSVGQPRDGSPEAAFGLFDPVVGTVELRRVGYDVGVAQERIRRAGLPEVLAERLAYGI